MICSFIRFSRKEHNVEIIIKTFLLYLSYIILYFIYFVITYIFHPKYFYCIFNVFYELLISIFQDYINKYTSSNKQNIY